MATRKEILSRMVIDEEAVFERLVDKAHGIFKIDKSGKLVFLVSRSKLTDRQQIAIALLGRYFASELGFVESDIISNREIADMLGMERSIVGARLADLRRERIAESVGRGQWRVTIVNIERILEELTTGAA